MFTLWHTQTLMMLSETEFAAALQLIAMLATKQNVPQPNAFWEHRMQQNVTPARCHMLGELTALAQIS